MARRLHPCASCARHVRVTDVSCPFCGGPMGEVTAVPVASRALSRAAVVFFGATTLAACVGGPGDPSTSTSSGGGSSSGTSSGASGSSGAPGASSSGTSGDPEPEPDPGAQPLYGPAPVNDAG